VPQAVIRGIGIDIVEISRVERAAARWGEAFLGRVFTDRERMYAGTAAMSTQRLAGRFAAKEAVMKALGLGWSQMAWREIEIANDPSGKPSVQLSGRAAEVARHLGVDAWSVSIAHTRELAIAQALAE
jgi:holo-[acyl-carrier protein] synthase